MDFQCEKFIDERFVGVDNAEATQQFEVVVITCIVKVCLNEIFLVLLELELEFRLFLFTFVDKDD